MHEVRATTDWRLLEPMDERIFGDVTERDVERPRRGIVQEIGAQRRAADALAKALHGSAEFRRLARAVADDDPALGIDGDLWALACELQDGGGPGRNARQMLARAARYLLIDWEEFGSPGRPLRWALHLAAEEEFGLRAWVSRDYRDEGGQEPPWERAEPLHAAHSGGLRAFVRALYDLTQRWLRGRGVHRVMAWRGELASAPAGFSACAVTLRALSSWTTVFDIARAFAYRETAPGRPGRLWLAEIPRERVLGLSRTGFGSVWVYELVVLAGPGTAWSLAWDGTGCPIEDADEYTALAEQHVGGIIGCPQSVSRGAV